MVDNSNTPEGKSTEVTNPRTKVLLRPPTTLPNSPAYDVRQSGLVSLYATNAEMAAMVFHTIPEGARPAICSMSGDPTTAGGWFAKAAKNVNLQCPSHHNNYLNSASFYPDKNGKIEAKRDAFAGYHALMLDDAGTKVPMDRLEIIGQPHWKIETSPGNFQVGYIFQEPITDIREVDELLKVIAAAGFGDPGSLTATRWMRLPVAINGKAKHVGQSGAPFQCRLVP